MELETQNHVCVNQLKRQDEEMKKTREDRDQLAGKAQQLEEQVGEERQRRVDRESKLSETNMMTRLKLGEALQQVVDLKQQIAQMEVKKAERWTAGQLRGGSVCGTDDGDSTSMPLDLDNKRSSLLHSDVLSIGSADELAHLVLQDVATAAITSPRPSRDQHNIEEEERVKGRRQLLLDQDDDDKSKRKNDSGAETTDDSGLGQLSDEAPAT